MNGQTNKKLVFACYWKVWCAVDVLSVIVQESTHRTYVCATVSAFCRMIWLISFLGLFIHESTCLLVLR